MRALSVACLLLTALFLCSRAFAQGHDPAAAEALFSAGREAFEKGDYATACPKFEESHRLDPGAGALVNLAACREKLGQLASAWESWRQALRWLAPNDERRPSVEQRAEAIQKRVPWLEIELEPGAPSGTKVERDGIELGSASLGTSLPVDPGSHVIVVTSPGHEPKRFSLTLAEADRKTLRVSPGRTMEGGAPTPTPPPPGSPEARAHFDEPARPRILPWVIAGVGAAGVVVGAVTGGLALGKKAEVRDRCTEVADGFECDQEGLDAAHAGKTFATISTIGFVAGAVALGVGAWLILSDTRSPSPSALRTGGQSTLVGVAPLEKGALLGVRRVF